MRCSDRQRRLVRSRPSWWCGALLAGGCQTDREVTRPEPVPVDQELLTEALLTQDDVPPPVRRSRRTPSRSARRSCPSTSATTPRPTSSPRRRRSVTFTGAGPRHHAHQHHLVLPRPGRPQVGDVYNDLLEDCEQAVVEDAGVRFTTEPLDFGVLSDDTLPLVVVLENDDGTIEERNLIVMRAGDLVSTIRLDGPRPTDLVVLDAVTRVAIGNLGRARPEPPEPRSTAGGRQAWAALGGRDALEQVAPRPHGADRQRQRRQPPTQAEHVHVEGVAARRARGPARPEPAHRATRRRRSGRAAPP